jgi:hypothetical protein
MVYCSKCGEENKDDTKFCIHCGTQIKGKKEKTPEKDEDIYEDIKEMGKRVNKKIEDAAESFGKKADDFGKNIEKRFDKAGKGVESWYDRSYGIFGPLITSFLGLIILRFIIGVMSYLRVEIITLGEISDILYTYLLWFFGLMLLSSYNTYFYKRYKKQYRWISPVFSAIGFVISIWIGAKILVVIGNNFSINFLLTIAYYINTYLIFILVIALFIGYTYHLVSFFSEDLSKK